MLDFPDSVLKKIVEEFWSSSIYLMHRLFPRARLNFKEQTLKVNSAVLCSNSFEDSYAKLNYAI